jgi:hypothetical protein
MRQVVFMVLLLFVMAAAQASDFDKKAEEVAGSVEKGVGKGVDATSSGVQKGVGAVDNALDKVFAPVDRKLKEWDKKAKD